MTTSVPAIIQVVLIPALVVWLCLACVLYFNDDNVSQIESEYQKCIASETILALPEAVQLLLLDPAYREEIMNEPDALVQLLLHTNILGDVIKRNRQRREPQNLLAHND